ncbi:splicing factor 3B subunit 1-like protein [Tanacetum coccineum]
MKRIIGMTKMTPPIKELLPRLSGILKNRHEKVQENCIDLVGRIGDRGAEYFPAREWMRICFELLEMLKAHKKGIRRAAVNTFGYIANAIGPQDVLATLLNNLKIYQYLCAILLTQDDEEEELSPDERKIIKLLLKVKNGTPQQRKTSLRKLTDKAREFGAAPLFNCILPLLMQPTLDYQERHLLNTTARAFSIVASALGILPLLPFLKAVSEEIIKHDLTMKSKSEQSTALSIGRSCRWPLLHTNPRLLDTVLKPLRRFKTHLPRVNHYLPQIWNYKVRLNNKSAKVSNRQQILISRIAVDRSNASKEQLMGHLDTPPIKDELLPLLSGNVKSEWSERQRTVIDLVGRLRPCAETVIDRRSICVKQLGFKGRPVV